MRDKLWSKAAVGGNFFHYRRGLGPRSHTCATIEVRHFFPSRLLNFGSSRPLPPKTYFKEKEKKNCCSRMKNPMLWRLGTQREIMQLFLCRISADFGLRSPVIQKTFQAKSDISIVACVSFKSDSLFLAENILQAISLAQPSQPRHCAFSCYKS